ncbi:hypothetical protein B0G83_1424 [Paraburkholderia sp. BL21I4N1]|nr:hypothetical protein B0G83_1424 [Paraburkholderia sp. BL21I4N1]
MAEAAAIVARARSGQSMRPIDQTAWTTTATAAIFSPRSR